MAYYDGHGSSLLDRDKPVTAVDYRAQTSLISGASSGIGLAFAHALAERGSNLVLVARRLDRLERLAEELTAAHGIEATAIAADLSVPGAGPALADEVARRGLRVTSLVNNAGFGTYGAFHSEDPERLQEMLAVNISSVVDVSRAFIDELRAAGTGVLVNVASLAAHQPIPNMAVYAASKAFVLSFTEGLWQESLGSGLRVLALSPGLTRTEFFDAISSPEASSGGSFQTPQQVVATALRALDRRTPPPSVISGTRNRLMANAGRFLSRRRVVLAVAGRTGSA
ncbi:SDR family oxidoreductase [Lentzea sp. CC55]|uniref:SDR family NAD(P)-dependent oxidoreductase n=1 Tax=Lentzea sp. CC55 TaxID=2884909 RepID=UPI001F2C2F1A|nr:SDR family oxidoreductase [Lentzea sp. CC55]MCG8922822.1 SDR family oxidoreductase [Lentzea sp. CC55]